MEIPVEEVTRETNALLRATSLNYSGYIEGRDIFKGSVDVVVCDGFVGNVVLKLSEGLAEAVGKMLKDEIKQSLLSKIGYLLSRKAFVNFKKEFLHHQIEFFENKFLRIDFLERSFSR